MSVVNAKSLDGAAVLHVDAGIAECVNTAFYHIYLAIISNYMMQIYIITNKCACFIVQVSYPYLDCHQSHVPSVFHVYLVYYAYLVYYIYSYILSHLVFYARLNSYNYT